MKLHSRGVTMSINLCQLAHSVSMQPNSLYTDSSCFFLRSRNDEIYVIMCSDAEVICCETVINPLEMFPHMTAAADNDDDDDIKFIFTIRYYMQTLYVQKLTAWSIRSESK